MKCDELKVYEDLDDYIGYDDAPPMMYDKSEVDAAIEEFKAEINRKEAVEKRWFERCMEARAENVRLKRALWLARASEASKEVNYWTCQDESSYAIVDFNVRHETIVSYKAQHHRPYKWVLIWENVERKCLKKAGFYL